MSTKDIDQDNVAQSDVLINCEESGVEILSQGKLLLNANGAEKKNWYHPVINIEDFVRAVAIMISTLEKITIGGVMELHQKGRCLIRQSNGKKLVKLYGNEITQLAEDVESGLTTPKELLKFITLDPSNTKALEQRLTTLSSFVIHAISGYIPQKILNQNTFTVEILHKHGWTARGIDDTGKEVEISDTQRYKMTGNAVTTNVIRHFAEAFRVIQVPAYNPNP